MPTTKVTPAPLTRSLREIALEIRKDYAAQGKPVYYAAVPYVDALAHMSRMEDRFYDDSAMSVVTYLLGNLSTWRGPVATRVRAELKAALADAKARGLRY